MKDQKRQAKKKKTPIKPKTNMPKTRVCWFTPQHGTCPGVWLTCPVIPHFKNKHSLSWQVLIANGFLVRGGTLSTSFSQYWDFVWFEPVLGLFMLSQPGFLFPFSCSPGSIGSPSQAYSKDLCCCFSLFSHIHATPHQNMSLSKPEAPPRNGHLL